MKTKRLQQSWALHQPHLKLNTNWLRRWTNLKHKLPDKELIITLAKEMTISALLPVLPNQENFHLPVICQKLESETLHWMVVSHQLQSTWSQQKSSLVSWRLRSPRMRTLLNFQTDSESSLLTTKKIRRSSSQLVDTVDIVEEIVPKTSSVDPSERFQSRASASKDNFNKPTHQPLPTYERRPQQLFNDISIDFIPMTCFKKACATVVWCLFRQLLSDTWVQVKEGVKNE